MTREQQLLERLRNLVEFIENSPQTADSRRAMRRYDCPLTGARNVLYAAESWQDETEFLRLVLMNDATWDAWLKAQYASAQATEPNSVWNREDMTRFTFADNIREPLLTWADEYYQGLPLKGCPVSRETLGGLLYDAGSLWRVDFQDLADSLIETFADVERTIACPSSSAS